MMVRFSGGSSGTRWVGNLIPVMVKSIIDTGVPSNVYFGNTMSGTSIDGFSGTPPTSGIYSVNNMYDPLTTSNASAFNKRHHQTNTMQKLYLGYWTGPGIGLNVGSYPSGNLIGGQTYRYGMGTGNLGSQYNFPINGAPSGWDIEGLMIMNDDVFAVALWAKLPNTSTVQSSMLFIHADQEYLPDIDDERIALNSMYSPQIHIGTFMNNTSGVETTSSPTYSNEFIYQPQGFDETTQGFVNLSYYPSTGSTGNAIRTDTNPFHTINVIPRLVSPINTIGGQTPLISVYSDSTRSSIVPRKLPGVFRAADNLTNVRAGETVTVNGTTYALVTNVGIAIGGQLKNTSLDVAFSKKACWAFPIL